MKINRLLLLAPVFFLYACQEDVIETDKDEDETPAKEIVTVLEEEEELTSFMTAFEEADLSAILEEEGPITVFAPNNAAFEAMNTTGARLSGSRNDTTDLTALLKRHIVKQSITFEGTETLTYQTLGGTTIEVAVSSTGEKTINGKAMVEKQIVLEQGFVYVIDEILEAVETDTTDEKPATGGLVIEDEAAAKAVLQQAYHLLSACADLNGDGMADYDIDFISATYFLTEVASDNAKAANAKADYVAIDDFTLNASHPLVKNIWDIGYDIIDLTNAVIAHTPEISMDETKKSVLLAEAQFLRAYVYFNLVQLYNNVPLLTEPSATDETAVQTSASEVYEFVIQELTMAKMNLPASTSGLQPTQYAAGALLARVYVANSQWQEAESVTSEIINSGAFMLNGDYAKAFTSNSDEETLWRVYTGNGEADADLCATKLRSIFIQLNGMDLRDEYTQDDDTTLFVTGDARYSTAISGGKVNKFRTAGVNAPVIRFAEVLLISAEAKLQMGMVEEAKSIINQIRERASLSPLGMESQYELNVILRQERRSELAFEGQRWFDIIRYGAMDIMAPLKNNFQEHRSVFPVPQQMLEVNPYLVQNPGY